MQKKLTYLLTSLFVLTSFISLVAQDHGVSYNFLMLQLEADMKLGRARSLRDMGSLLADEEQKYKVQQLLQDYTIFLPEEIDLSKSKTKKEFLEFYYKNAEDFKFSDLLNSFYLTPIEEWDPEFIIHQFDNKSVTDRALQLRKVILEFEEAEEVKNVTQMELKIKEIAKQKSLEGYQFLLEVLKNNILNNKQAKSREEFALLLTDILSNYPKDETVQVILKCAQKDLIQVDFAAQKLAVLTNHLPKQLEDADLLTKDYLSRLDSLEGIENMRARGYEEVFAFNKSFFEFPVDYYGRILSLSEQKPWIRHNALKDIISTKHPRTLFYIAAQIYQYRDRLDIDKYVYVEMLENLTELKIDVVGSKGKKSEHNWQSDRNAQKNYVAYWASHYEDYEWDEIREQFINKTEKLELTKNYERLFRRLNSENDSIAQQAWLLLAEGDPVNVIGLANKYKELLRNYNTSLPSFKYDYLEQVVQMTDFCKRNNIRYKPSPKLQFWLEKLRKVETEQERYQIENRIVETLTIDEISAIEYWGLIHENNTENAFSVGRILDWYYSENWNKVLSNETQLRLYLKKAKLFSNIGVIGVCNHYMNKFGSLYPELEANILALLKVETDKDIIAGIELLLFNNKLENKSLLASFMQFPSSVNRSELASLPLPSRTDMDSIFTYIKTNTNRSDRQLLLEYVNTHLDKKMTPYLMDLLRNKIEEKKVVSLIEKLFHHSFRKDKEMWLVKWKEEKGHFEKWEKEFFFDKTKRLKGGEILTVKDLNSIIKSKYYEVEKHKKDVMEGLVRLEKIKYIRRFRIEPLLEMPQDLAYFERMKLTEKELDDIPRLFDLTNPKPMIAFLVQQAANFGIDEKGSFFNNLFRANWFANYVNDGLISKHTSSSMTKVLEEYLHESDLISEFEEQATIRNIALLNIAHLPLEEKLKASKVLELEAGLNAMLEVQKAIVARIDYLDIGIVAQFFHDLKILDKYNFLNKDFGLPIFNLANFEEQKKIQEMHQRCQEDISSFYAFYLDRFGVDYQDEKGELDFGKIYNILKYDIVTPFVGDGGNRRDYFTYGMIKILEKEFETDLGFHVKLNENQTFYSFSAAKRAAAWMNYLESKRLVTFTEKSPSFNWTGVN